MTVYTDKPEVVSPEVVSPEVDIKEEDFLSRWSRRKHETRQQQALADSEIESIPEEVEVAPLLTDADMPPIESLTEDSDYSGFLSPKVSEALRKQALKKLFHCPGFNICDGLDDYDEDFTKFEKLGDIITSDMKHQLEMEAKRIQERAEEEVTKEQNAKDEIVPTKLTPEKLEQEKLAPEKLVTEKSNAEQNDVEQIELISNENSNKVSNVDLTYELTGEEEVKPI